MKFDATFFQIAVLLMKKLRELKFAVPWSLLLFTFPIYLFLPLSTLGQDITPTSPAFERRDQPVTKEDLLILEKADKILSDETKWNRKDDRTCRPEDKTWSLFCALQKASIEVLGKYDHRRVALQEVRFIIEDLLKGKEYEHRLMEYNNLSTTQFSDIKKVLKQATDKVAARLSKQDRAATRIPNFDNAIPLEENAETTANANIGDLDGDGDPDIVLAKGRHWPLVDLVLLNDVNGDGSPDIVAARSDAVSMLYFNSLKMDVAQKHGVILNDVPHQIDATKRYLFYLHGKLVEQDRRKSPQYGVYEYDQILDRFKG